MVSFSGGMASEKIIKQMKAAARPGMMGWLSLMPKSIPFEMCSRYTTTMVPAIREAMVPAVDAFSSNGP